MFLKLVRGNGVISHSSCLDVLKIKMERRGEGNSFPPPCLDVFKISKGEGSN